MRAAVLTCLAAACLAVPLQAEEVGVRVERDVPYAGTDDPRQTLDVYLPTTATPGGPLPVVVFIHGGGWEGGGKSQGAQVLQALVGAGYAGVSVGYRLTDTATWPAQIHDCKAAIRWVRANADKYGFDPDRIGVGGASAGGHLVCLLGTTGPDDGLDGDLGPHADVSAKVACVADYFGPTDFPAWIGQPGVIDHDSPNAPEAKLLGGTISSKPDLARAASPITYVDAGDPPFLIVHGTADELVAYDQAVRFDKALRDAEVSCVLVTVEGGGHGGFPPEANQRVAAFFDKHLRGADVEVSGEKIVMPAR